MGLFLFIFHLCFEKSSSFCRENEIFKNKKKKMDQFLTLEKAKIGPAFSSTAYIYIYIYGCGLVCRRKFCHFWRFFPQFYSKTVAKTRCCKFAPSLFLPKKGLGLQSQAIFWKKSTVTAVPGLFPWLIWVSKLIFCLFGKKNALNRRNVKHIKLVLSKNG